MDLGKEMLIGSATVMEIEWPETLEFALEYKEGEAWKEIAHGTTIGAEKNIDLRRFMLDTFA